MLSLFLWFSRVLNIIPAWAYAGLILLLILTNVTTSYKYHATLNKLTATEAKYAKEEAERSRTALAAEQKNRAIEQERQKHVNEIITATVDEKNKTAVIARRLAADNASMRDKLAAYAAGGGITSSNPAAPSDPTKRAATLGLLLATCREQEIGDAEELEGLATQVRGLLGAYNTLTQI